MILSSFERAWNRSLNTFYKTFFKFPMRILETKDMEVFHINDMCIGHHKLVEKICYAICKFT